MTSLLILHHVHDDSISCLNVTYQFSVFPHSVSDLCTKVYIPKLHQIKLINVRFKRMYIIHKILAGLQCNHETVKSSEDVYPLTVFIGTP